MANTTNYTGVQVSQDEAPEGTKQKLSSTVPDEETVLEFFSGVFAAADEARKPRESIWKQAWLLYNGQYDFSGKAAWQSKVNISMVRQAVDRAAATFRRALVRMRNFFGVESESRVGYQQGLFTRSLLDYWLDRADFVREFTSALKVGLITSSIIMKVWWEYCWENDLSVEEIDERVPTTSYGLETGYETRVTKRPKRTQKLVGKLGIRAVDPFKFWVVPGSEGRFVIERTDALLADVQALADKGIYDKDAVKDLVATVSGSGIGDHEEADRKGESSTANKGVYLKSVSLFHYWGDIHDKDGKVLMKDCTFTVAGSMQGSPVALIRKPHVNPFFHGRSPYVVGTPYVVPFSTYNRGIVEDVAGVATMITELSNLIADGAMFDAIKAFEVDVDQLYSQAEAADGVYPGKTFRKKGLSTGPVDKPMIKAIDVGRVPTEAIRALGYFDSIFQKGTQITEFTAGFAGGGGRTATEVQSKTAAGMEGLDDAARTVEETTIEPLLDLAARTIYQFHTDYSMARLSENFPQASMMLRDLSPAERYVLMAGEGGFRFKARGISVMLDKQKNLEKIGQFLQITSHIPGVLQRLNVDYVLEDIAMALGWNPEKALVQPSAQVQVMGQQGPNGGTPFPPEGAQTPAQMMAGQQGAEMGGAANNPMANNQLFQALGQ